MNRLSCRPCWLLFQALFVAAKTIQPGTISTITRQHYHASALSRVSTITRQHYGSRLNVALSFFEMPNINIGMHVGRTTEMPHK